MTKERINQAKAYADSPHVPTLARKFIRDLLAEREHWKRLSDSQSEAIDMIERGVLK